ncbi:putative protein ECERIFERUM 26-like [Iris pallida]|uniref:Uncharacterized protein n=1 Tax=Iris pallida TaxID=29817 RepID=A0AAX6HRE5_IRIPA|nr:putative protein ECERIFERUM 26-like [Iris pallida]
MVSDSGVVTGHRLSTVTTASVTGDAVHELSGADLAMRLHYLRILYYFRPGEAVDGTDTPGLKEPMFPALDRFSQVAGRVRKGTGAAGRPHIKCNDSGVRVVEARCEQTVEEWLEAKGGDWDGRLVPDKVLGPDLSFSPLVFIQFTRFKGGGLAVGVSWPHVLGDAVSASNFINLWGRLLAGKPPLPNPKNSAPAPPPAPAAAATGAEPPLSLKRAEPDGDDVWLPRTNHRMATSSFRIAPAKLEHLRSKMSSRTRVPAFEAVSGLVWKIVAEIRAEHEPTLVTVIRNDRSEQRITVLSNSQVISTVAAGSSPAELGVEELAALIGEAGKDEREAIEEAVEKEDGTGEFIVYGANLTFVDMGGADLYSFNIKGQKPECLEYNIGGVGDEGTVVVLQEPEDDDGGGEVTVTVILPEHEMPRLKLLLGSEWGIA